MAGLSRGEAVLAMGACFALLLQMALAATYTVGGASNWTVPPNAQLYTSWVSGKTFKVGDELVFNFQTGQHDVTQVTKANYDSCGKTNSLLSETTGPAKITLNTTGAKYYICSVGAHCQNGQKLSITVAAASSPTNSPSPSPSSGAASPPPSSPPTPSATPATPSSPSPNATPSGSSPSANGPSTTPTNDNSSASRLTASLGILSGAAALFLFMA